MTPFTCFALMNQLTFVVLQGEEQKLVWSAQRIEVDVQRLDHLT